MAVLANATASGRQFYQGYPATTATSYYTAPTYASTTNVTSPSATAYVKEIVITSVSASAQQIYIFIGGTAASNAILYGVSVAAGDVKVLSGLNTMIPAGQSIYIYQQTASALTVTISGVEVV